MQVRIHRCVLVLSVCFLAACNRQPQEGKVITFPGSVVGGEGQLLQKQLRRFQKQNPDIRIVFQKTPDASNQRHQLFVQWLNAGASDPDILQLDVIWTAEFGNAGWILPLDKFEPNVSDFFPATIQSSTWNDKLYAIPWFVDVGMLYYREDLVRTPPKHFDELVSQAEAGKSSATPYGFVWQGARYEGLVCVFLEHLGGFGGEIMDDEGHVRVDSQQAVKALTFMRDCIYDSRVVPEDTLTWREEQTRFRFQNGQAVFLRNWPYCYSLFQNSKNSKVAGKFGVTAMPFAEGGRSTATLGGQQLAINRHTEHPQECFRILAFLTAPEQMRERYEALGQFPPRESLYDDVRLKKFHSIVSKATARPVTPVYTELSEILQIWLQRALTRQVEPEAALTAAASEMRAVLRRVGLEE